MKHSILPLMTLALLLVPQSVDAQRGGRGPGFLQLRQNQVGAFLERADSLGLDLSDEQAATLETLRDDLDESTTEDRDALAELFGGGGPPGPGMFQEMQPHLQAIQEANEAALRTAREEVLTDEQWTAVESYLDSIQPPGRGGRRGGGPPG